VASKSAVQIRSHAQKFFSKLQREAGRALAPGFATPGLEAPGAAFAGAGHGQGQSLHYSPPVSTGQGGNPGEQQLHLHAATTVLSIPPARPKRCVP